MKKTLLATIAVATAAVALSGAAQAGNRSDAFERYKQRLILEEEWRRAREAGQTVAGIEIEGGQVDPIVDETAPRAREVAFHLVERQVERVLVETGCEIRQRRQVDLDVLLMEVGRVAPERSVVRAHRVGVGLGSLADVLERFPKERRAITEVVVDQRRRRARRRGHGSEADEGERRDLEGLAVVGHVLYVSTDTGKIYALGKVSGVQ